MNNTYIVLQHDPKDIEYFTNIQNSIKRAYPDFKAYSTEKLHMTLFHFGYPSTIYKDLLRAKPGMVYNSFERHFIELLTELNDIKSNDTILKTPGIVESFGYNDNGKIVLRFENSPELKSKRTPYLTKINEWFEYIGIKKPILFMRGTKNFKHNDEEDYKPHVTLGFTPKGFQKISLPEKETLFGRPYLINYDKLFDPETKDI